jgi:hypothetical protein
MLSVVGCVSAPHLSDVKANSLDTLPGPVRARVTELTAYAQPRTVRIRPSIFKVGTGCMVTADGWILTAEHVIRGEPKVQVVLPNGVEVTADVWALSLGNDFALIKAPVTKHPHFKVASEWPDLGDRVVAFGAPGANGKIEVSAGVCIYPKVRIPGDIGTYYFNAVFHSAPIFPGDSGGPLINLAGRLVGVHGGFASENASVAPATGEILRYVDHKSGRMDPGKTFVKLVPPVIWPAERPRDFAESTWWTVRSVADTLVAVYAPGRKSYVRSVLSDVRKRYLDLRERDERTDDDLVRAMLAEVFSILEEEQKTGGSHTALGTIGPMAAGGEEPRE